MEPTQDNLQQLSSITRKYMKYQGLGWSLSGVLWILFGAVELLDAEFQKLIAQYNILILLLCGLMIQIVVRHFYYRPKFGYVKPLSESDSTGSTKWDLVIALVILVCTLGFAASASPRYSHLPFDLPVLWAWGIITVMCVFPEKRYRYIFFGLPVLAVAVCPVFHILINRQVRLCWYLIAFGISLVIAGIDSHRNLLQNVRFIQNLLSIQLKDEHA